MNRFGTFFVVLCTSSYFVFYYVFSQVFTNEISHLFVPAFSMRIVGLVIVYVLGSVYGAELAYSTCKRLFGRDKYAEETREMFELDAED